MDLKRIENVSFNQNCLIFFDIPSQSSELNLLKFFIERLIETIEFLKLKNISIHCVPIFVKENQISKEIDDEFFQLIEKELSQYIPTKSTDSIAQTQNLKNEKQNVVLLHPKLFSFDWNSINSIQYENFVINSYKFFDYFEASKTKINKSQFCISSEIAESMELLDQLSKATLKPKVGIFGGTQIQSTLEFLDKKVKLFQNIILSGSIGITALKANGLNVGNSPYSKEEISNLFQIINKANFEECEVELPVDHIVVEKISPKSSSKISPREISNPFIAIDIGPKSIQKYEQILKQANFILFHAPVGLIELEKGRKGTLELLKIIQKNKKTSIITGNKLCDFCLENKISLKLIPDFEFILNYLNQSSGFFKN
jgi:hypothetical protein